MAINEETVNAIDKLKQFQKIRQRQVFCPVTNETVMMAPLTVGDDISLRSMLSSPDVYDRELLNLIYNHVQFIDRNEDISFAKFIEDFSDFDRRSLLWGVYAATYSKFPKQEITCPNCQDKWEDEISAEEVVEKPDFMEPWDRENSFKDEYKVVDVSVDVADIDFIRFNTKIPNMKKHLDVLQLLDEQTLKDNFNNLGQLLSRVEEISLITESIEVHSTEQDSDGNENKVSNAITKTPEIHNVVQNFISFSVVDDVIDEFNNEFSKYSPTFEKQYQCSKCGHEFDFPVDIEVSLFQKFLRLSE